MILAAAVLGVGFTPQYRALAGLPGTVQVAKGEEARLPLAWHGILQVRADRPGSLSLDGQPLTTQWRAVPAGDLHVGARATGLTRIEVGLFGWLPVSAVAVDVRPTVSVVPGGQAIGVVVQSDGVSVVDEAPLRDTRGGERHPARDAGVQPGDVILSVAGQPIRDKETAARLIDRAARAGKPVDLRLKRGDAVFHASIHPVWDPRAGRYLIGLWIRDGATGVGTMSFYDPSTRLFAALGHLISDARTGEPFPIRSGQILPAVVSGVNHGSAGEPGEKLAVFVHPRTALGEFRRNTSVGIFGHLDHIPAGRAPMAVALPGQVHTGDATILTVLRGQQVEAFRARIERVTPQVAPGPKGLVIRVTDPRLLAAAGGIVQGMSGSPILQDGRLAGVVTHVFVNDPTRGYGVFAFWMAEEAGLVPGAGVEEAPGP